MPFIQVYYKGKLIPERPSGFSLEDTLEFIDKLTDKALIKTLSNRELNDFSNNYGDVSFVLIHSSKEDKLYECFVQFAEEYKPNYYFGYIPSNKFNNINNIKLPGIIVNKLNNPIISL